MQGVSSRTRSRNATRFQSLDDIIPYKRRKKVLKNVQRKKAKHVVVDVEKGNKSDEVEGSDMVIGKDGIFIDDSRGSVADKPIILDSDSDSESDDDNNDDHDVKVDDGDDDDDDDDCKGLCSSSDEKGTSDDDVEGSESSSSEESRSSYDDEKEEEEEEEKDGDSENRPSSVNNDESGVEDQEELNHGVEDQDESGVDDDHDVNRDLNVGDDDVDGGDDVDDDDDDCKVLCFSSDEKGTSDDDFEGSESSSSEESCSSYDDDDDDDEKEEEEVVVRKVKNEINGMRRCTKDGVNEKKHEKVEEGDFEKEKELWDEMDISLREEEQIDSLIGNIGINVATPKKGGCYEKKSCIEKEGCFDSSKFYEGAEKKGVKRIKIEVESDDDVQVIEKKTCIEKEDCFDSSKLYEGEEKKGVKRVKIEVESDDDVQVMDFTMPSEVKAQKNKKKKEYSLRSRQNVEPVLEEIIDSTKVQKNQRKNANANEKKVHKVRGNAWKDRKDNGDHNVKSGRPFKPKELRLMEKLFAEWGEENSKKKDSIEQKENDGGDVHKIDAQQLACAETIWSLDEKFEPLEKSEAEKKMDELWEELNISLKVEQIDSLIRTNEAMRSPTSLCEHNDYLHLDEEIGWYCKMCGFVKTEIKNISPPVVDRFPYEGSGSRVSFRGVKGSPPFDESQFNDYDDDSEAFLSHKEGTVWDFIPDVKQSLYPHQQEGFEFIWKNLAGNIDLNKLKSEGEGGCIICHYPGTGKTRLTIMFLKTYLKVFDKCFPVIVAPPSLLPTWEDEFKKWDIGVPFHNLNNPELSGKEHHDVVNPANNPQLDTEGRRMVKLCSWLERKSILGISYNLYEQLAGSKTRKKNGKLRKDDPKMSLMGRVLCEVPGLLVLDEGHKPRNENSCIWKALVEQVQTKKRIILSGTPFQNNFFELYNTLTLVKPSFPKTIPRGLKKFCRNRQRQKNKSSEELSWEPISSGNLADDKISQLKSQMDSFVHVHSGSILKKNLPGLRKCVLTLKPDSFQKEILDSIESSQKWVMFEHKVTLASVHPSLFLRCNDLTKKEESVLDKERLEELRLDPRGGVKTRFLVYFVSLCDEVKEKVLVFSQFIKPLRLIIKQLKSEFDWSVGKEVLYMSGNVDPDTKQSRIDTFNDPNGKAKIMLASTKACNEGISLVGASRVVLLDVVWNPSVERQAISRAYRLGQKKIVYTYHLITEGTAELMKYRKQGEKDRLSELVFSDKDAVENGVSKSCAVNFEDRVLDEMINHEKLKDMFGERVVEPMNW